jgi:antitoxin HicB
MSVRSPTLVQNVAGSVAWGLDRSRSDGCPFEVKPLPADEGGGFLAWVPDLPGCASDGATQLEAINNAAEAIDEWIEEAQRLGRAIPAPTRKQAAY